MLRETMSDLEERLDPRIFRRIHRSIIVNLRRVKEVRTRLSGDYFVVLGDGTRLKIGRSRPAILETLLDESSIDGWPQTSLESLEL